MSKRLRRKDLKGPDEFVSSTQQALEYARERPRQVAATAGALVLVLATALGVRAYREWRAASAAEALGSAYQLLRDGDLERAAVAFRDVSTAWSGTPQGELALVYAGNAFAELKKDDESRGAFEELLATRGPALRQIALYNLAVLDRNAGRTAEAEKRFREAASIDGPLRGAAWVGAVLASGEPPLPDQEIPDGVSPGARELLAGRDAG